MVSNEDGSYVVPAVLQPDRGHIICVFGHSVNRGHQQRLGSGIVEPVGRKFAMLALDRRERQTLTNGFFTIAS